MARNDALNGEFDYIDFNLLVSTCSDGLSTCSDGFSTCSDRLSTCSDDLFTCLLHFMMKLERK